MICLSVCCAARSSTAQSCDVSSKNVVRLGLGAALRASVRRHRRASRVASGPMDSEQLSPSACESIRRLAANLWACDGAGRLAPATPARRPGRSFRTEQSDRSVPAHSMGNWERPSPLGPARTIGHLDPSRSSRVHCMGSGSAPIGASPCSFRGLRQREIRSWLDAPIDQGRR